MKLIHLTKQQISVIEEVRDEIREGLNRLEEIRSKRGEAEGFIGEIEPSIDELLEASYADYEAAMTAVGKKEQLSRARSAVELLQAEEYKANDRVAYLACLAGNKVENALRPFVEKLREHTKAQLIPVVGAMSAHSSAANSKQVRGFLHLLDQLTGHLQRSKMSGEDKAGVILPILEKAITKPDELPYLYAPKD